MGSMAAFVMGVNTKTAGQSTFQKYETWLVKLVTTSGDHPDAPRCAKGMI
jgi:hypothetical protein